ncbi:MAG: hypothetical protein GY788_11605 [bacterium]|nr:hypothetical protein [bacterium]
MNSNSWKNLAREHWKEFQPTRFKALQKASQLEQALDHAVSQTHLEMDQLTASGFKEWEAWPMVREQYLLPPEEPGMDQPAPKGSSADLSHQIMIEISKARKDMADLL